MKAIEGQLINGRFSPIEHITLPKQADVIVLIRDLVSKPQKDSVEEFLKEFNRLIDEGIDEELPEFPRFHTNRELVTFKEEVE